MGGDSAVIPADLDSRMVDFIDRANAMSPVGFKGHLCPAAEPNEADGAAEQVDAERPTSFASTNLSEALRESGDQFDTTQLATHSETLGLR